MALRLEAVLTGDGTGFQRMMASAELTTKRLASSGIAPLKNLIVGAFSVGAIETFGKKIDELANSALRLGAGVEFLQEMGFAARQSSVQFEHVVKFIEKLNQNRASKEKGGAWAALGISPENRMGNTALEAQDLIRKISEGIQGKNPQAFIGSLISVGGKSAGEVQYLIQNLERLRMAAHEAGAIIAAEDVAAVKAAKDEMQTLAEMIMTQLAPALAWAMKTISNGVNSLKANGTFWGAFTAQPDFGKRLADWVFQGVEGRGTAFSGPGGLEAFKKAWEDAGAKSLSELETLNANSDALFKKLLEELKRPPAPRFDEAPLGKARHLNIPSNAMLAVGNFLGATGRVSIADVAERTNQLLTVSNIHLKNISAKMTNLSNRLGTGMPVGADFGFAQGF